MTSTSSLCVRCSVLARLACVAMRRCSRAPSSIFRTLVESPATPQRCRNHATGQNSKLAISDAVSTGSGRLARRPFGVRLDDTRLPYVSKGAFLGSSARPTTIPFR